MNNVCKVNQNITDKFKHLDDVQYQQEYDEHCRKMSIIDSYEEEIKEVLFLSSGCVDVNSHSYKQYGLGLSPDYINLKRLIDKIQHLRANTLGLEYDHLDYFGGGDFELYEDAVKHSISFVGFDKEYEYTDHLLSIVNKYSKEFYGKEYFLGWKNDPYKNFKTLIYKDETWNMEYLRMTDTLKSWKGFTIAILVPIFGWSFVLYSMYEAVRLYIKHKGEML